VTEHLDVLVVGAGLSGIGAGYHLQTRCPQKSYAILEARGAIGGTWDLFRYPGIRSDSDMHTMGYAFRPWRDPQTVADGPSILHYIRETAAEYGIDRRIRLNHRVVSANWSEQELRWTVEVDVGGKLKHLTCEFMLMCSGYYRYDAGYTPKLPGMERFQGQIVHPQHWPEKLDYEGKRVVVIGSGATAVTLVPAMARRAAHVTMLQRSPSYVVSIPGHDGLARILNRRLPPKLAYQIVRWRNVLLMLLVFQVSRRRPSLIKRLVRKGVERQLPAGYDVDTHFRPRYNPWDQRMCAVPDGDLFAALSNGSASVVTDEIETFTERGLRLASGTELEADLVVTATGLQLQTMGGLRLELEGAPIQIPDRMTYKGMMLEGVPNMAFAIGYTNASWALKCDLTCEYACRLLNHMDKHGYAKCVPVNHDPSVRRLPLIDFNSSYILRSIHEFPKQGSRVPWRLYQNYARDILLLRFGAVDDEAIEFSARPRMPSAERPAIAA